MKQLSQASPLACDCRASCSGWRALPFWNKTESYGQRKPVSVSIGARFISSSNEEKKGWLERQGEVRTTTDPRHSCFAFCVTTKGIWYIILLYSRLVRGFFWHLSILWLYSAHNHTITVCEGLRTGCCFPSIRLLPWTQRFNQALW